MALDSGHSYSSVTPTDDDTSDALGETIAVVGRYADDLAPARDLAALGEAARSSGDEVTASRHFCRAMELAFAVAAAHAAPAEHESWRLAIRCALADGQTDIARDHLATLPGLPVPPDWEELSDASLWPDAWLVAAIRRADPDTESLDILAVRHWKHLYGRCQLLTLHRDKASDLAQEAWCRVLRNRAALRPGGNFAAYLTTVATNLWRDQHRSALRAGPLADQEMASLDLTLATPEGATVALGELLPDLNALDTQKQAKLRMDLDHALERLAPLSRDILIARFLDGESCADIGQRYGRTEQTISGWVRRAILEIRTLLEETPDSQPPAEHP